MMMTTTTMTMFEDDNDNDVGEDHDDDDEIMMMMMMMIRMLTTSQWQASMSILTPKTQNNNDQPFVKCQSDTIESCIWIRTDTRSLSIVSRAKSEALDNIYSLLKQNIKSCNAKRRRQRER